jgi:hypothetical protein
MSQREPAERLLREAYDALTPYSTGSSDEADRKAELRERIRLHLNSGNAAGGGGGPATFGYASAVAHGDTYGVGGGGGGAPDGCIGVTIGTNGKGGNGSAGGVWPNGGGGMGWTLPSDMPETGILLDVNGKSRTVTKAELQRMIDDGEIKFPHPPPAKG